jgi:hypothetical protein
MNPAAELLLSCRPRITGLYVLFAIQLNKLLLKSNNI